MPTEAAGGLDHDSGAGQVDGHHLVVPPGQLGLTQCQYHESEPALGWRRPNLALSRRRC
jgi:hypothetical protein